MTNPAQALAKELEIGKENGWHYISTEQRERLMRLRAECRELSALRLGEFVGTMKAHGISPDVTISSEATSMIRFRTSLGRSGFPRWERNKLGNLKTVIPHRERVTNFFGNGWAVRKYQGPVIKHDPNAERYKTREIIGYPIDPNISDDQLGIVVLEDERAYYTAQGLIASRGGYPDTSFAKPLDSLFASDQNRALLDEYTSAHEIIVTASVTEQSE